MKLQTTPGALGGLWWGHAPPRPAAVWAERADGKRQRVPEAQEKDERGVPVWTMAVARVDVRFGEQIDVYDTLTVPAPAMPAVSAGEPVVVRGLVMDVRATRDGQQRITFTAEAIEAPGPVKRGES